jgi:hypothetical protein
MGYLIGGTAGSGGGGTGGVGSPRSNGTNGTANTGGGAGGASGSGGGLETNGGSGVVIVRYADTYPLATATTGSPTVTTTGGYRIYRWTGSGSITI